MIYPRPYSPSDILITLSLIASMVSSWLISYDVRNPSPIRDEPLSKPSSMREELNIGEEILS